MNMRIVTAWIILTLFFLLLAIISFTVTTEDAYISFRYAENIADGYGPVFNRGGEIVEGYSNPTWVFLLAIIYKFGQSPILAARCLGLLFGSLTLLELILLFKLLEPKRIYSGVMAAIVLATAPSYLFWTQTGLENSLFIYLLVLGLRLALTEEIKPGGFPFSALAYFLLALTRPEGIMCIVIIGAWKIADIGTNNRQYTINRLILWAVVVALPLILFLAWRFFTFDAFVPNTFFAKVNNGIRWNLRIGTIYFLGFMNHSLWATLILPIAAMINLKLLKPNRPPGYVSSNPGRRFLQVIFLHAIAFVLFILYVGGDIHPYDRFGVPFVIFSSVVTFLIIPWGGVKKAWKRESVWACVIFVILNLGYSFPPAYGITPPMNRPPNFVAANIAGLVTGRISASEIFDRFMHPPVDALEFVGRDLRENPEITGLLAVEQCGKIPYFYEGPVLDLLGLNDSYIAGIVHSVSTWDRYASEVLSHQPETFVMVYSKKHFISRYYIENMVLSLPFRNRYALDAIYHVDYRFTDISGIGHTFVLELVRYRALSAEALVPLTDEELGWCKAHDPVRENPDVLADEVESFRQENQYNPEKVINYVMELN